MELLRSLVMVLSMSHQADGAANRGADQPGWITREVTTPDGSMETLLIRDTFVNTHGAGGLDEEKWQQQRSGPAKIKFETGDAQKSCDSEEASRAPWIAPAEAQKCADLGLQILDQTGYWEGWDWAGGFDYYGIARLADCEFGIARVDGLESQAKFGNLDVGYLLGNVSDAQNGLVSSSGFVQVGGSMRCLGAPMAFSVGKTAWPVAGVE